MGGKEIHPHGVIRKAKKFRWGMCREGVGAWFSLWCVIDHPGIFKVDYNYDDESTFPYPLDSEFYANDYFQFPREREYIPSLDLREVR